MKLRILPAVLALTLVLVLIGIVFHPGTATADTRLGYRGWGIRGGFSGDPNQLLVGAYWDMGELARYVQFVPNAQMGFGDGQTLFSVNPDVAYVFPAPDVGYLYAGGGLGLQWWFDGHENGTHHTDSALGLHAIGGLGIQDVPLRFELSLGLADSPTFQLTVGYTFRKSR